MQNRKNVTIGLEIWSFVLKRKCLGQRRLPFYLKKKKIQRRNCNFSSTNTKSSDKHFYFQKKCLLA